MLLLKLGSDPLIDTESEDDVFLKLLLQKMASVGNSINNNSRMHLDDYGSMP